LSAQPRMVPFAGRNLGDDQGMRVHQDQAIPTRTEALNCSDRLQCTSQSSAYAVWDEEIVSSGLVRPGR
jgi:hypothetical protein